MKAMIFAAGLGTRLRPLTNDKPKALVEINGTPLLEITIKRLISYGFNDIIVNVHHFAESIIRFLQKNNNFGIKIDISDESNLLLDTGGGLKNTSRFFNDNKPFLVHNVDIISDINLNQLYETHINDDALATLAMISRRASRYLLFDNDNSLCAWKNIKTNETKITKTPAGNLNAYAFTGIHIISPSIFDLITEQGVFSIIDVYLRLAKHHKINRAFCNNSFWIDVGRKENLIEAEKVVKLRAGNQLAEKVK